MKSKERKFIAFIEINEWEGESWRIWLQQDDNEEAIALLSDLFDEEFLCDSFRIGDYKDVPESHVDILVKYSPSNYADSDRKFDGIVNLPKLKKDCDEARKALSDSDADDSTKLQQIFYKNGIADYIKKPKKK